MQHDRDPQLVAGVRALDGGAAGRGAGPGPPVPSAVSLAGSPGAMTDSSTSSRSTANRVGAPASGGRNVGAAAPAPSLAGGAADAAPVDDAGDDPSDGAADASASASGVTE